MQASETAGEATARARNGHVAIILCVCYWIATVGGIILMTNLNR